MFSLQKQFIYPINALNLLNMFQLTYIVNNVHKFQRYEVIDHSFVLL